MEDLFEMPSPVLLPSKRFIEPSRFRTELDAALDSFVQLQIAYEAHAKSVEKKMKGWAWKRARLAAEASQEFRSFSKQVGQWVAGPEARFSQLAFDDEILEELHGSINKFFRLLVEANFVNLEMKSWAVLGAVTLVVDLDERLGQIQADQADVVALLVATIASLCEELPELMDELDLPERFVAVLVSQLIFWFEHPETLLTNSPDLVDRFPMIREQFDAQEQNRHA